MKEKISVEPDGRIRHDITQIKGDDWTELAVLVRDRVTLEGVLFRYDLDQESACARFWTKPIKG